jgi:ligand-binding sensor domain-containing protein
MISDSTLVEFDGRMFIPHPVEKTGQTAFFRQQIAGIAVDTHNRVITNLISLGDVTTDASSTALFRFSSTGWEIIPSHARYYSKGNHPVAAREDDTVWAGSYDGLIRQTDPQQFLWKTQPDLLSAQHILTDSHNTKWISAGNSFRTFDDNSWNTIERDDTVVAGEFVIDSRDRKWLWKMVNENGILCVDGDAFVDYTKADGIPLSQYSGFKCYLDPFDTKWFLSNGNGVIRYDNDKWTHITTADGLAHNSAADMVVDYDRVAWFACGNSISRFDGVKWATYTGADQLPTGTVSQIFMDDRRTIWAVAAGKLVRFQDEKWESISEKPGSPETNIKFAVAGQNGTVYVTGSSGVFRWDGFTWKKFPIPGQVKIYTYYGYVDRKNRFWFSVSVSGVYRLVSCDGDSVRYHQQGTYTSITEDRNGVLWFVSSDKQILSYDGRAVPESGARPKKVSLLGNYPNPFNAGTSIVFDIYSWGRATVDIHSITGQKVRTLHSGIMDAGRHEIVWDGADGRGARVSSGVYFARIRKDGAAETKKMMFLK